MARILSVASRFDLVGDGQRMAWHSVGIALVLANKRELVRRTELD